MPAWSDLASDALEHVTSFLALADQHRFSAFCHNWRSVAKRKRHPPAPQLPWLVLGEDEKTKKHNFFNLSEQRLYSIDIPELYGHFIVSSSYGWLFTVDKWINGHLVNPFTKESFELAPFPPFFDDDEDMTMTYGEERILNSDGVCIALPYKEVQTRIVFKAVLSHDPKENPDFTVIILFNELRTPAIWRPGDTVWTIIDMGTCHLDLISDVIWFEGNFYANSMSDIIFALDMVGSDPEGTKMYSLKSFESFCKF
ncbi:hypothetical protein LUZ60_001388 [Juncus effusus]|nr:hypothetical protein LUZ60_001388 [Juncus effusus]